MCTHAHDHGTHRDVVGLPADSTHVRTGRQAEGVGVGWGGGGCIKRAAKASSLPSVLATYMSYERGEKEPETQQKRCM